MIDSLHRLKADGHDIVKIFTFDADNVFAFNTWIMDFAQQNNIAVQTEKPSSADIQDCVDNGVELFISAGYPYKIPGIETAAAKGINLHPSMLPLGRGSMPAPYILMDYPEASGFTIHLLTDDFDKGDILYQEALPLAEDEDVESFCARIAMRAPHVLSDIVQNFDDCLKKAKPQTGEASYWPPAPDAMRFIDTSETAQRTNKRLRAFGRFGCLITLENKTYAIFDARTWQEHHTIAPGTIACHMSREVIIAIQDGFLCLKHIEEL